MFLRVFYAKIHIFSTFLKIIDAYCLIHADEIYLVGSACHLNLLCIM